MPLPLGGIFVVRTVGFSQEPSSPEGQKPEGVTDRGRVFVAPEPAVEKPAAELTQEDGQRAGFDVWILLLYPQQ